MFHRHLVPVVLVLVAAVGCSDTAGENDGSGSLVVTDSGGVISRVDPDTGDTEQLSDGVDGGIVVQATPSTDGTALVWTDAEGGEPFVVVHAGGSTERIAAPTAPFFYVWAPGDERIAALGNDPDGTGVALLVVDVEAGAVRRVDAGSPYYISWSEDGDQLAAHIGGESLVTVSLEGERTAVPVRTGLFQAPDWATDGRVLAVVATERATASIGRALQTSTAALAYVDPASGEAEPLLEVDSAVSFDLAPDDARVAVVDGVGGAGTMFGSLVVAGGDAGPVTIADEVVSFEWSPDGSLLLFHTLHPEQGLVPHVWDGESATDYPGFVPTEVFVAQYLPFWSQYNQTITQWAPDSSAFAYAYDEEGEEEGSVFVQPIDGDRRRVIAGEMVIWSG